MLGPSGPQPRDARCASKTKSASKIAIFARGFWVRLTRWGCMAGILQGLTCVRHTDRTLPFDFSTATLRSIEQSYCSFTELRDKKVLLTAQAMSTVISRIDD